MNQYIILLFTTLGLCACNQLAYAAQPADSAKVYFKLGHRQYSPELGNNAASMNRFIDVVRRADADSNINNIEIRAYASPDGTNTANERLSINRSKSVADYITEQTGISASLIDMLPEGIAWQERTAIVEKRQDVPYHNEVLRVLKETPVWVFDNRGVVIGSRKKALMDLRQGVPYRWLFANVFPNLRNAVAVSLYLKNNGKNNIQPDPATNQQQENATNIVTDTTSVYGTEVITDTITTAIAQAETFDNIAPCIPEHRFALKTNLLYDALLMPSLEFEWRINNKWSVAIESDLAWWKNDPKHKYYQIMYIQTEVKWWLLSKGPWHGMYAGAFAGGGKYDLENGKKGYKGEGAITGLSVGYMWPIARNLSLEAAIGVGYMYTRYKEYRPYDGHYLYERTATTNYFGPLKAKFAFVWRFGDIKCNKKKGGLQ